MIVQWYSCLHKDIKIAIILCFCTFRLLKMDAAKKSMEIQQQARNNANELSDFLRSMKPWQEEMQAKDKQLLEAARIKKEKELEKTPSAKKLVSPPLIRASKKSCDNSKVKKKSKDGNKTSSESSTKKSENIKAYDYSAWDKFDVEKACEEVDIEVNQSNTKTNDHDQKGQKLDETDNKESDEPEANEEAKRTERLISKQEAVAEKERGNQYFKVSNRF